MALVDWSRIRGPRVSSQRLYYDLIFVHGSGIPILFDDIFATCQFVVLWSLLPSVRKRHADGFPCVAGCFPSEWPVPRFCFWLETHLALSEWSLHGPLFTFLLAEWLKSCPNNIYFDHQHLFIIFSLGCYPRRKIQPPIIIILSILFYSILFSSAFVILLLMVLLNDTAAGHSFYIYIYPFTYSFLLI